MEIYIFFTLRKVLKSASNLKVLRTIFGLVLIKEIVYKEV